MTRHFFIPILSGIFLGCGLLFAEDRTGDLRLDDRIYIPETLIADYLRYRETVWRLNPPPHEEPLDSIENAKGDGWYEKSWSRWLALPGWFVRHGRSPDSLSEDLQSVFWDRGQLESVQIWEHPGREMLYIGRETTGKDGVQILARYPAPDWEIRKGESVQEFYERELATRRIVWTIRSPFVPVPEAIPTPAFRTLMALQPDELHLRWSAVDPTEMEAEVEFGSSLSGGPFTLWYLEGSLMSSFPSAWSVGYRLAERPSENTWNVVFPNPGGAGNLLFVRATLGMIDSDTDGMDDGWEIWFFGNMDQNPGDHYDNDGLTNLEEYLAGTDPTVADSDGDGIWDGDELTAGTNPLRADNPQVGLILYRRKL